MIKKNHRFPEDLTESPFWKEYCSLRKRIGDRNLDLTVTNPTDVGLTDCNELLQRAFSKASLAHYRPHPKGDRNTRLTLSRFLYQEFAIGNTDPDSFWLTSSTSEAYSFLFKVLAEPEASILIPRSSYPLLEHLALLESIRPSFFPMVYSDHWQLDLDELARSITTDTRALVLIHPNNPTGSYVSDAERRKVFQLCNQHQIPLIVDEVFWPFFLEGSSSSFMEKNDPDFPEIFVLGGLSKFFGMPQLKLSWIHANQKARERHEDRLNWVSDQYLSVGTPVQNAFADLLLPGKKRLEEIRARIKHHHELLNETRAPFSYLTNEGGWSAILKIPDYLGEEEVVLHLLREHGVSTVPGFFFDLARHPTLVVSLIVGTDTFEPGIRSIGDALLRLSDSGSRKIDPNGR